MTIANSRQRRSRTDPVLYEPEMGDSSSQAGERRITAEGERQAEATGEADAGAMLPAEITYQAPVNDRPERGITRWYKPGPRLARIIHRLAERSPWRELTREEKAEKAEIARRQAHAKALEEEAKEAKRLVINALVESGRCYRYKKSERDYAITGVQKPWFRRVEFNDDAIYMQFGMPLPRNLLAPDFTAPELLTTLSLSVGRRIQAEWSEVNGLWYIIERSTGVRGVPMHVKYADVLEKFPASADGLYLPMGLGANRRPVYYSAGMFYHALVGGATGSGKSVLLNTWLCTLIRRNKPDKIKLLLIDLKGGVEFQGYEGIPHLFTEIQAVPTGIVNDREQVVSALQYIYNIGEARLNLLRRRGYRDIGRYNSHNRANPLEHIFLVADELADLMMDREIKRDAEELLANMAARHRAVGLHMILCTQMPKVEVITGRIKANCPLRVALSCANNISSQVIIDDASAAGLAPKGRAIVVYNGPVEVQTPLITDAIIEETIEGAKAGVFEDVASGHDVTPLEVMTWALENDQGKLPYRGLFAQFSKRGITLEELRSWLAEWEGKRFIIGSTEYTVLPGAGQAPRRLVPVETE